MEAQAAMAYSFDKRKINRGNNTPSALSDPSQETQMPNSLVMRIMEDPAAEQEADRLSRGVTSHTPGDIMQEMGSRLGADFSAVQFHSDTLSMNRSRAMGARAWAQGSDVHFGKGGFDPKIAAHELVHTVQQGAVEGNVSQFVPNGTVQLFRGEDENAIHRRENVPANAGSLDLMNAQKLSSDYGRRVFADLKKPIKSFAQQNGARVSALNEDTGILFLSNLADRDYSGEAILKDIATRSVINKDEMWDRTDEYEGFLDYMKNRIDKVGLESVSLQTNILQGNPKYDHNADPHIKKRAYEMTAAELAGHNFNPTQDAEVLAAQQKIDAAQTPQEVYYAFLSYTEGREFTRREINASINQYVNNARQPIPYIINDDGERVDLTEGERDQQLEAYANAKREYEHARKDLQDLEEFGKKLVPGPWRENFRTRFNAAKAKYEQAKAAKNQQKQVQYDQKVGADVNIPLLKIKLKNMVRQVRDYPELKHRIGGLNVKWNETKGAFRKDVSREVMSTHTSANWRGEKVELTYDAFQDRATPEGQQTRDKINADPDSIGHHLHYVGNHELGHAQGSFLNETDEEHGNHQAESDILEATLQQVIPNDYPNLPRVPADSNTRVPGQIDTKNSQVLTDHNLTSEYGQTKPSEWFAESFHDVYTKGADARPARIAMVKEYEKRMTAKQKAGFQKKKHGLFSKIGRFFSRWVNFGQRHGAQQPVAPNADPVPAAVPQQAPAGPQPQIDDQDANPLQLPQNNIPNNNPQPEAGNAGNVPEPDLIAVTSKRKIGSKKKKKKGK